MRGAMSRVAMLRCAHNDKLDEFGRTPRSANKPEQAVGAFGEDRFGGQEADDEVAVGWEVEEVAGVDEDVALVEEFDGEFFVGAGDGNADGGVPAALNVETAA